VSRISRHVENEVIEKVSTIKLHCCRISLDCFLYSLLCTLQNLLLAMSLYTLMTFLFISLAIRLAQSEAICDIYLATSTMPNSGKGVFAGRPYTKKEEVQYGPILFIRSSHAQNWQLMNYGYGNLYI
jgi:hypothetical protein